MPELAVEGSKNLVQTGLHVVKTAFFIVVGYMLAKVIVGFVSKAVPQVAAFANLAVLLIGIAAVAFLPKMPIVPELALGAAVYAAIAMIESFVMPLVSGLTSKVLG
jgi:hypothetical protein